MKVKCFISFLFILLFFYGFYGCIANTSIEEETSDGVLNEGGIVDQNIKQDINEEENIY